MKKRLIIVLLVFTSQLFVQYSVSQKKKNQIDTIKVEKIVKVATTPNGQIKEKIDLKTKLVEWVLLNVLGIINILMLVWTIYAVKNNLKYSKYVEIRTSQRIKWIENVSTEFATIITNIHFSIEDCLNEIRAEGNQNEEPSIEEQARKSKETFVLLSNFVKDNQRITWNTSSFVMHLNLFKLKLVNGNNDNKNKKEIIDLINDFIFFYENGDKDLYYAELIEKKQKKNKLFELTQDLLKKEWEQIEKDIKKIN